MRSCVVRNLGRMGYAEASGLQEQLAAQRKQGLIPDHLLFVEHDHVVTLGRNARESNVLAPREVLERAGIGLFETNRGGDVTYHGPGQVVAYSIFDLREWRRDVGAYIRGIEQVVIGALEEFGLTGVRETGMTGVWVNGAKVCAIGVHLSRWVSTHGLALNVDTDLSYFRYIVPCGLTRPVTSMRELGVNAGREAVIRSLTQHFGRVFGLDTAHTVSNPGARWPAGADEMKTMERIA